MPAIDRSLRANAPFFRAGALWASIGLFLTALAGPAPASPETQGALQKLSADDEAGRAEFDARVGAGEPAALEALATLSSTAEPRPASLARRRLARVVLQAGGARCIDPAIGALVHPDPDVRRELLAFLARADLGDAELPRRIEALASAAASDPDRALRSKAIQGLAALDRDESLARLAALIDSLDEPARAEAARLLAEKPRARSLVLARLADSGRTTVRADGTTVRADRTTARVDPAVLAPLLVALGRDLGDRGETAGASALLAGLRSPDPLLRRGAGAGLDLLVRRLFAGTDANRFSSALDGLVLLGYDRGQAALLRARAELLFAGDPKGALAAARELAADAPADGDADARSNLALSRHLEASALIAEGSFDAAGPVIADEARLLDGLLAERPDRESKTLDTLHASRLHRRAQCELLEIVRRFPAETRAAGEAQASDPALVACLESARRIHALELAAQAAEAPARGTAKASLDSMLDGELSPLQLVLENPRLKAWPAPRALALRKSIGRLFASVARSEAPGFEPFAGVPPKTADPLQDDERRPRLVRVLNARSDELRDRLNELLRGVRARMASDPTAPSDEEDDRIQEVYRESADLQDVRQRVSQGEDAALLELRAPSLLGMSLARSLRDEGREEEARAMGEAVRADLDKSGELKRFLLVEAEIEMTIGSTWIDSGDPARAEIELVRAVERLEAIEKTLRDRGASAGDLAVVRGLRASALVSLAVNANVKLGDPKKALAYFERAFELREDEFTRVLLACYRARSGRGDEARAILRQVSPSPANLYNVACTWALLGEKDLAIDCLRRDLEENPMSEGAREKQKEWARKDPDLASIRDDPRFRALVGG